MATGSGKTFTAVNVCYRLIKFGEAKRILFLVDRNNLGRQTLNEFQQFVSPVQRLQVHRGVQRPAPELEHHRPGRARSCITTIQRLYSMLKGEEEFDEENEEAVAVRDWQPRWSRSRCRSSTTRTIPIETFDFIIVDECHRSIYNLWRQVLEYFDAFLIGLTATPTKQTIGFFNNNLVMDYGHEQAVADGVNVGFDVYRIETEDHRAGGHAGRRAGRVRAAPRPPHQGQAATRNSTTT